MSSTLRPARFSFSFVFLLLISHLLVPSLTENRSSFSFRETSKSYFPGIFRRFAFPPGTFLIFTPELTLPTWREYQSAPRSGTVLNGDGDTCDGEYYGASGDKLASKLGGGYVDGVGDVAAVKNSAIDISSPFFVYFDKLGWTHEDSIYGVSPHVGSFIQEYLVDPALHLFGVPPPPPPPPSPFGKKSGRGGNDIKRDKIRRKGKELTLSESHRLAVFRKIERLLEDLGADNGRACLLRAICEIHEFPFDKGRFGIFGEVLALILSVHDGSANGLLGQAETETSPCMSVYSRAEKNGRNRNCLTYAKHCPFSIFQWVWNMNLPKLSERRNDDLENKLFK